jgi:hypothetical protein
LEVAGMNKVAAVFPVLPGKDAKTVAEVLTARPDEWRTSREKQGVHFERAYEQPTPMGTFVIAYIESDRPFAEVNAESAKSDLPIDQDFMSQAAIVHGFDPTQPPPFDPPEVLGDWVDENVTERKPGLAFCVPVMPGAEDTGRAFAKEAYEKRRDELAASRRALGITHDTVVLNHGPQGDVIAVYLEGDDPVEGNRRFAASRSDYDVWFKDQCKRVFPPEIDLNEPVPPVNTLFDSERMPVPLSR